MSNDSGMDPQQFYDDHGEDEWERLDANPVARLEFENTTVCLAEHLPDPEDESPSSSVHVLDAGGGPGRYACWLAGRG